MAYWLVKSEPNVWSWEMQKDKGEIGEPWTGVRNYQARNNMRTMRIGEKGFFYHSNHGREIVGIFEVITRAYHDPTANEDFRWECVDIRAVCNMPYPVRLYDIKSNPSLAKMILVIASRLSVQPVTSEEYLEICRMGKLINPPISEF
ncbi:MAG: EVE domain-containing protein [Candidatus Liberibacter europaeus]|uniref:EVE domain-containing protein n=1 Tax=Candidatus Liberibacter europaeus TaxID=744859 RepID=A0A2T4VW96_9HYPH|nr:EVE domain-containing protein [Candidatus Liberibacter europaeus]PTL86045.1 MAG: EVE domain-containing protein [Candidatus Liberibacter europaeus]